MDEANLRSARWTARRSGSPDRSPPLQSYRPYKGLAFWLYLTRGWIEELPTAETHSPIAPILGQRLRWAYFRRGSDDPLREDLDQPKGCPCFHI